MLKVKSAWMFIVFAMMFPVTPALRAQTAATPAAPLPSQILTAKRVFISNAGVGADRNYNQFYTAIKSGGRYELVAAPAYADLVLEISLSSQITGVSGSKESGCSSTSASWFKLAVLDPRTRIVLWAFAENIKPFFREKTGENNMDDAMTNLASDLEALTAQPAAAIPAK
jgi:hypothetical protein